jgi:hypothetical protein
MPGQVPKSLLEVAAEAVRHLAWYLGYRTSGTGARDV